MIIHIVATLEVDILFSTIECASDANLRTFSDELEDFKTNAEFIFEENGFSEDGSHSSDRNGSNSYYFIKERKDGSKVKIIFYVRISDHALEPGHNKLIKEYLNATLVTENQPKTAPKRIMTITVDGINCKDFIEAETRLQERVKDLASKY